MSTKIKPIKYTTKGTPTQVGVYACRIPYTVAPQWAEDKFLLWNENQWFYLSSDQKYRGPVLGFIGPLDRLQPGD